MAVKKKTILVVDDEPDIVDSIKSIISKMGDYTVVSAYDGKTGLEKARAVFPDLIILDVVMPEQDGFSLYSYLTRDAKIKDIPVIMLTGVKQRTGLAFSAEEMGEFFGKEPATYIEKPIDSERLQEAIKKILKA